VAAVVAQRRCPSCLLGRTRSRRPPTDREPPEEPRRSPTHPASASFGALRALNLQISHGSLCVRGRRRENAARHGHTPSADSPEPQPPLSRAFASPPATAADFITRARDMQAREELFWGTLRYLIKKWPTRKESASAFCLLKLVAHL